jgi:hypothetical protein
MWRKVSCSEHQMPVFLNITKVYAGYKKNNELPEAHISSGLQAPSEVCKGFLI